METCTVSERHHLVKLVREGISVYEPSRTLGGIEVCRSRVGHPEGKTRHERMHRTPS
jgi:hypothetical protein